MSALQQETWRVALIGARGHVGAELLTLIRRHPNLSLVYAASRIRAGEFVFPETKAAAAGERAAAVTVEDALRFAAPDPDEAAATGADICFLALPNGMASCYVDACERTNPDALLIDLSADHRSDPSWVYGVSELDGGALKGARRISNPGCYATAAQLALAPLREFIAGAPRIFGVSGYSGAGSTPSRRNDLALLADNLMPYGLIGHSHEVEIARRISGRAHFLPHVAPHFRGLSVTIDVSLRRPLTAEHGWALYRAAYGDKPFIRLTEQIPEIRDVAGTPFCHIGGIEIGGNGARLVVVAVLDNLLKGAASQAVQNLNLALQMDERAGIL